MDYDIHDLALFLEFSLEKYSKLRRDQTMLLSLFKPLSPACPMIGDFSNDKKVCVATIVVDSSRWIWLEIPLSENSIHVVTR
jgi:hypothetical protein